MLGYHLPYLVLCPCEEREALPPRSRIQQSQPRQDLPSTVTPHPQDSLSVMALQGGHDSRHALILLSPAYCSEHRCRTSRRAYRARLGQCRREGLRERHRSLVSASYTEYIYQLDGEFP